MGDRERRKHRRVQVRAPGSLRLEQDPAIPIEVVDLSEGGTRVYVEDELTEEELAVGTRVHLSFSGLEADGEIVRQIDDSSEFGVEFGDADESLRGYVRSLLDRCAEAHVRALCSYDDDADLLDDLVGDDLRAEFGADQELLDEFLGGEIFDVDDDEEDPSAGN